MHLTKTASKSQNELACKAQYYKMISKNAQIYTTLHQEMDSQEGYLPAVTQGQKEMVSKVPFNSN